MYKNINASKEQLKKEVKESAAPEKASAYLQHKESVERAEAQKKKDIEEAQTFYNGLTNWGKKAADILLKENTVLSEADITYLLTYLKSTTIKEEERVQLAEQIIKRLFYNDVRSKVEDIIMSLSKENYRAEPIITGGSWIDGSWDLMQEGLDLLNDGAHMHQVYKKEREEDYKFCEAAGIRAINNGDVTPGKTALAIAMIKSYANTYLPNNATADFLIKLKNSNTHRLVKIETLKALTKANLSNYRKEKKEVEAMLAGLWFCESPYAAGFDGKNVPSQIVRNEIAESYALLTTGSAKNADKGVTVAGTRRMIKKWDVQVPDYQEMLRPGSGWGKNPFRSVFNMAMIVQAGYAIGSITKHFRTLSNMRNSLAAESMPEVKIKSDPKLDKIVAKAASQGRLGSDMPNGAGPQPNPARFFDEKLNRWFEIADDVDDAWTLGRGGTSLGGPSGGGAVATETKNATTLLQETKASFTFSGSSVPGVNGTLKTGNIKDVLPALTMPLKAGSDNLKLIPSVPGLPQPYQVKPEKKEEKNKRPAKEKEVQQSPLKQLPGLRPLPSVEETPKEEAAPKTSRRPLANKEEKAKEEPAPKKEEKKETAEPEQEKTPAVNEEEKPKTPRPTPVRQNITERLLEELAQKEQQFERDIKESELDLEDMLESNNGKKFSEVEDKYEDFILELLPLLQQVLARKLDEKNVAVDNFLRALDEYEAALDKVRENMYRTPRSSGHTDWRAALEIPDSNQDFYPSTHFDVPLSVEAQRALNGVHTDELDEQKYKKLMEDLLEFIRKAYTKEKADKAYYDFLLEEIREYIRKNKFSFMDLVITSKYYNALSKMFEPHGYFNNLASEIRQMRDAAEEGTAVRNTSKDLLMFLMENNLRMSRDNYVEVNTEVKSTEVKEDILTAEAKLTVEDKQNDALLESLQEKYENIKEIADIAKRKEAMEAFVKELESTDIKGAYRQKDVRELKKLAQTRVEGYEEILKRKVKEEAKTKKEPVKGSVAEAVGLDANKKYQTAIKKAVENVQAGKAVGNDIFKIANEETAATPEEREIAKKLIEKYNLRTQAQDTLDRAEAYLEKNKVLDNNFSSYYRLKDIAEGRSSFYTTREDIDRAAEILRKAGVKTPMANLVEAVSKRDIRTFMLGDLWRAKASGFAGCTDKEKEALEKVIEKLEKNGRMAAYEAGRQFNRRLENLKDRYFSLHRGDYSGDSQRQKAVLEMFLKEFEQLLKEMDKTKYEYDFLDTSSVQYYIKSIKEKLAENEPKAAKVKEDAVVIPMTNPAPKAPAKDFNTYKETPPAETKADTPEEPQTPSTEEDGLWDKAVNKIKGFKWFGSK